MPEPPAGSVRFRAATAADVPALDALIVTSARTLSQGYYTPAETEAAIAHVFGVDSELVADGTYLLAEIDAAIAGCGGWSRRRTLFGGDRFAARASGLLDPAHEAARIRAFFVDPRFARAGIGTHLLTACETRAAAAGFTRAALMATLPGVPFYTRHGYVPEQDTILALGGVDVRFVPMEKPLRNDMLQK